MKIRSKSKLVLLLLLCVVVVVGCQSAESTTTTNAPISADENPDAVNFTLTTLDGEQLALSDLRGRHVLVNFWATWCIPCRAEMPYLQALTEERSDEIVVLGVNMGEDPERVAPFVEQFGLSFTILLDPPDQLTRDHNVRGLPVTFVVDEEGVVVYQRPGEIDTEEFDQWMANNLSS